MSAQTDSQGSCLNPSLLLLCTYFPQLLQGSRKPPGKADGAQSGRDQLLLQSIRQGKSSHLQQGWQQGAWLLLCQGSSRALPSASKSKPPAWQ